MSAMHPEATKILQRRDWSLSADSVEKVQFRERSKICGGAGAFIPDLRGGPHHQRDFKWATVASTLQGIALTKIGFGMRSAKFCGHIIFEFFNTIGT